MCFKSFHAPNSDFLHRIFGIVQTHYFQINMRYLNIFRYDVIKVCEYSAVYFRHFYKCDKLCDSLSGPGEDKRMSTHEKKLLQEEKFFF